MRILAFLLLAFTSFACGDAEPAVQQLPATGSISELVRSPVTADGEQDIERLPRMQFDTTAYYFGTVEEGAIVEYTFTFENTGQSPLLITDARSNCGCTIPEVPEGPVAAGARSQIGVRFNTEKKTGAQEKPVTITANTYPTQTTVYLRGTVLPKSE